MKRSLRNKPAVKTKMSLSTRNIVAGVAAIVISVSVGVFLFSNLAISHDAKAGSTITAKTTGNWSNTAIWYFGNTPAGRLPQAGDLIEIAPLITVTENLNISFASPTTLNVFGTLDFDNGKSMDLNNGYVNIATGGKIRFTGTSNATYLKISTYTVIDRNTAGNEVDGPASYDKNGVAPTVPIALPIRLISFTVSPTEEGVRLDWLTAAEDNNDHFTIERSTDAKEFKAFATIQGAGTTNEKRLYTTLDKAPLAGVSYYRLRQTDINGTTTVSKIVSVTSEGSTNAEKALGLTVSSIGPNPFEQSFSVDFDLASEGSVAIQLTDTQGKVFLNETQDRISGNNHYDFFDNQGLHPGIYLLSMKSLTGSKVIRMVKK